MSKIERPDIRKVTIPNGQIVTIIDGAVWVPACTIPPKERPQYKPKEMIPKATLGPSLIGEGKKPLENNQWLNDY